MSRADVRQIETSAGPIEVTDTGGAHPPIVFLHGLLMDASLWDEVIADLGADHRCIAPTLPLGSHRLPMHADADLSPRGIAHLVTELLERLDLHDATVVGNDTGGALIQLLACDALERVGRVVLASCDAFDNFPPGLTGKTIVTLGRLPPSLFGLFMQQLRFKPLRRLPISFGWLTKRGDVAVKRWLQPVLHQPAIRQDAVKVLRSIAADRQALVDASPCLAELHQPALVAWAKDDRVMPPAHGRRLTEMLPNARRVEIEDSYTLLPLDQPRRVAEVQRV